MRDWRTLSLGETPVRLFYRQREAARMCQRLDSTWYAVVDQHLHHSLRRRVDCTSYEKGCTGLEMWFERHKPRLDAEFDAGDAAKARDRA